MKRAMARAASSMVMATKRTIVTNGDNTGNGNGEEGDRHLTVATMGTS
jgi:hypothetical protein